MDIRFLSLVFQQEHQKFANIVEPHSYIGKSSTETGDYLLGKVSCTIVLYINCK